LTLLEKSYDIEFQVSLQDGAINPVPAFCNFYNGDITEKEDS
jgi:hypothetical protein